MKSQNGTLNYLRMKKLIAPAQLRLRDKLVKVHWKNSGISEYNQRYLGEKLRYLTDPLILYGGLIALAACRLSGPLHQMVLVDYGGGSGLMSLLAKEAGVGTGIYSDIYDVSCEDIELLSNIVRLPLDHIVCGDIEDLGVYLREHRLSVDAIVSYDVLEHIYNVEQHVKSLVAISDRRFCFVYGSGANIQNPLIVRSLTRGHQNAEFKTRERKWGHKERDSLQAYFDIRKEIVANYAPELAPGQVAELACLTRGLIRADIEKSVDEYRARGEISYRPDHPTNTCDPLTGNWAEHLMKLEWLSDTFAAVGFAVEIFPGLYRIAGTLPKKVIKRVLNIAILLLGKRGMTIAPYYIVFGCKTTANGPQGT